MKQIQLDGNLYGYLLSVSLREPEELKMLREETAKLPMAGMQISPDQGQFMGLLVKMIGAKKAIEVGTFTGYSAASIALSLPDDGRLIACDVSEEFTNTARKYWKMLGVENKIDLRLSPATQTLEKLISEGQAGTFDFAFIDADKKNYSFYYEKCLELLRSGGVITIDNVLWSGAVADESVIDHHTITIRELNKRLHTDNRVDISMIGIGDGLTIARKK